MKKLLVLMLVLGTASVANAAIVISADGNTSQDEIFLGLGDTVVIGINSDDTENYMAYLDFYYTSEESYRLSNPRFVTGMVGPTLSMIVGPYDGGYDNDELEIIVAAIPGENNTPGVQFEIDLQYLFPVEVFVELHDYIEPYPLLDTLTIYVPEPLTLSLLVLGGMLVLRRRK